MQTALNTRYHRVYLMVTIFESLMKVYSRSLCGTALAV